MPDNLAVTPGAGVNVLANEASWSGDVVKVQGIELFLVTGAEGSRVAAQVSSAAPLPVDPGQSVLSAAADAIGCDTFRNQAVTTKLAVLGGPGRWYGYHVFNPGALVAFLHFYDATLANVTVGTTVPKWTLGVPPGGGPDFVAMALPLTFATALTVAATTSQLHTGSTIPSTGLLVNLAVK